MKWLFILLVAVNVTLFVIQLKDKDELGSVGVFSKALGSKEIKLLNDGNKEASDRCIVVGAFSDEKDLSVVAEFLAGKSVEFEIIEKESVLASSYWVYVLDDAGEDLLERLAALGIDNYLIASGELKGRLSVGLFANIDLAKDMILSLKEKGIDADLFEKTKTKKTKWLSFDLDVIHDGEHIIEVLKGMQINLGEIKEFFCKSIASEK